MASPRSLKAGSLSQSIRQENAMKLCHRDFLCLAAGVAALAAVSGIASAQTYPSRPVTMVVPFAAGGAFDVIARVMTPRLSEILHQQVIVENVGAAAGIVGT